MGDRLGKGERKGEGKGGRGGGGGGRRWEEVGKRKNFILQFKA